MNRRNFIALGGAAMVASRVKASSAANPVLQTSPSPVSTMHRDRPNILLLMADQLRMDCVGVHGNRYIKTPNLDRIGNEGIRFQSAYSTTPTCVPARTALLTGLGPWRHGMLGYTAMASNRYPVEKARALAEVGYYTTSIGKNHYFPIRNPHGYHHTILDESRGFWFREENFQTESPWQERPDYESWFWSQMPDKDPGATGLGWNDFRSRPFAYPERMHPTHWTGETAVRFLKNYDRTEPFFLKVSFIRPHSPYDAPERFFKMYEGCASTES